jgi:hypothetical protein
MQHIRNYIALVLVYTGKVQVFFFTRTSNILLKERRFLIIIRF